MLKLFLIMFLTIFSSCDEEIYYSTFDYKTMEFRNVTKKNDHCIRYISKSDNKIEFEVIYDYRPFKRTFLKQDDYWYSKYKYKTVPVEGYALANGEEFEINYYIFNDHIVYCHKSFITYVDLKSKIMYVKDNLKYNIKNIKNINISQMIDGEYITYEYYTQEGTLLERIVSYKNNIYQEEVINETYYYPNLDIFFWLDIEIYSPGAGIEPIYD